MASAARCRSGRRCGAVRPPWSSRRITPGTPQVSADVMTILRGVTPLVEPLSLDEAFLDVSGAERRLGRPAAIAARIRADVRDRLALTCSVGVGLDEVRGQGRIGALQARRPVGGAGGLGVWTSCIPCPSPCCGASGRVPPSRSVASGCARSVTSPRRRWTCCAARSGTAGAEHLHALSWGRDPRPVQDRDPEKSISADHTTSVDLTHEADVLRELLRLAGEVSERVRRRGLVARTVGIKIRFADFRTVTRVRTLSGWADSTAGIYDAAADLYRGLRLDRPRIRLVGVKCENLRPAADSARTAHAGRVRSSAAGRRRSDIACDRAADAAKTRFGSDAVRPGHTARRLLPRPGLHP